MSNFLVAAPILTVLEAGLIRDHDIPVCGAFEAFACDLLHPCGSRSAGYRFRPVPTNRSRWMIAGTFAAPSIAADVAGYLNTPGRRCGCLIARAVNAEHLPEDKGEMPSSDPVSGFADLADLTPGALVRIVGRRHPYRGRNGRVISFDRLAALPELGLCPRIRLERTPDERRLNVDAPECYCVEPEDVQRLTEYADNPFCWFDRDEDRWRSAISASERRSMVPQFDSAQCIRALALREHEIQKGVRKAVQRRLKQLQPTPKTRRRIARV